MASDKSTSTERLLGMIRGGKGAPPPLPKGGKGGKGGKSAKPVPPKPPKGGFKLGGRKAAKPASVKVGSFGGGGRGGTVVGVDIAPDGLRMARVSGAPSKPKIHAFTRIPYGPDTTPDQPGFIPFLQSSLRKFCGAFRKIEVWAIISSAKSELWHIQIPKVPKSQIQDAVYWTVKKEKQFDEAEFLLDFEVQGEVMDKGVQKLSIMVYLAPRKQVEEAKRLFSKAGVKLAGATISPIAIQTLFRSGWVPSGSRTFAHLYVGRNWSRIDIFIDRNLVLSRGIKAGTNSMVEALMENYNMLDRRSGGGGAPQEAVISLSLDEETPTVGPESMGPVESQPTLDLDQARRVLRAKLLGYDMNQGEPGGELSEEEALNLIRPAAERLVRQVERTFEYHITTMGNERVERIFFSGEVCVNKRLIDFFHSQLGIAHELLDPLRPGGMAAVRGVDKLSVRERLAYNLVVALAISDNAYTPNLLYTYADKDKVRRARQMDKAIYAVSFVILLILGVVYWLQLGVISSKKDELAKLKVELGAYKPPATEELLVSKAGEVNLKYQTLKKAARNYEGVAILAELSELTPSNLKLVNVYLDFDKAALPLKGKPKASGSRGGKKGGRRYMDIDGMIIGEPETFSHEYTSYLIRLENSKLFGVPKIKKANPALFPASPKVFPFSLRIPLN